MTDERPDGAATLTPPDGVRPPEAQRARRRRRRLVVPMALVALFVVLVVVAGSRLLTAPVWTELGAEWAGAEVAATIGQDVSVHVGVIGLSLTPDLRPRLHLRDIVVEQAADLSVSIDEIGVTTDWWTLAGQGRRIGQVTAGHVVVDAKPTGEAVPGVPTILAATDRSVRTTGIEQVAVEALTLRRGDGADRLVILDRAVVEADARAPGEVRLRLSGAGAGAGAGRAWTVDALAHTGEGTEDRAIEVRTGGLDVLDVARMIGGEGSPVSGPLSFTGRIGVTGEEIASATGELSFDSLENTEPGAGAPTLNRGRLSLDYSAENRRIRIDPSPIVTRSGHAVLTGAIDVPAASGDAWTFALMVDGRNDTGGAPLELEGFIDGSYTPSDGQLVVDEFKATGADTSFVAAMRLRHGNDRTVGALSGVFPTLSVETLKTIWPSTVVTDAREWIDGHVHSGTIRDATVELSLAGSGIGATDGETSAEVTFRFENLTFRPLDDGPLVREAIGTGRLHENRLEIAMERGVVDLEDGRTLAASDGRFVIPSILQDPADGEAVITLAGEAKAAFGVWNRLPLSRRVSLPVREADVSGTASATIEVALPLLDDVRAEDVRYSGRIGFKGLDIAAPLDGRTVTDADIEIALADGLATITGTATVDGLPAEVDLSRSLNDGGPSSSIVKLILDDERRRSLGVDLGDFLTGSIAVTLTEVDGDGGPRSVEVDLTEAAVSLPALGYSKPAGKAGTATMTMAAEGETTNISDVQLTLPGLKASGSLTVGKGGRLLSAQLPSVSMAGGDRLSVKAARKDGRLVLTVAGSAFDARSLIKARLRQSADGGDLPGEPVDMDLTLDNVTGFGGEVLSGVNVAARLEGGRLTAMTATMQTAGGGAASMTLAPIGAGRRLEMEVGEIGRLLRFADLYGRVFGGRATITGIIDATGTLRAAVDGSRWRIVEEPALARLSTAAEKGPTAGFSTADIERLMFELRFADGTLSIEDGVIRAQSAGLSIQGDVDFRRDALRLAGTYLPASAFDSLIGKIPLLGQLMSAGGRAGLVGVTFRISGPIEQPSLSINPLSVIAPGIFRKLFEIQ